MTDAARAGLFHHAFISAATRCASSSVMAGDIGSDSSVAWDPLGDGQAQSLPFGVTFLPMRRYRIMYQRLHAVGGKVFLQCVAPVAPHREDVPHVTVALAVIGQHDVGMVYLRQIDVGNAPAMLVVGVEVGEFCP